MQQPNSALLTCVLKSPLKIHYERMDPAYNDETINNTLLLLFFFSLSPPHIFWLGGLENLKISSLDDVNTTWK